MSTIPQPNEEREKEYKQLQASAKEIYEIIMTHRPDTSLFELVTFSTNTLLKAIPLFPEFRETFVLLMRQCVTISLATKEAPTELKLVPKLLDASGNPIL